MREIAAVFRSEVCENVEPAYVILRAVGADIDSKATLIASATDGAVKRGAMAGSIIKEIAPIVGGKGGGRPTMAQAGGTDTAKIEDALAKAAEIIKSQIK